ncbi:hypothetical protein P3L10_015554 [Capsicum annuum]
MVGQRRRGTPRKELITHFGNSGSSKHAGSQLKDLCLQASEASMNSGLLRKVNSGSRSNDQAGSDPRFLDQK